MKILFLDIDGVLNSQNTTNFKQLWPVDMHMAFMVGKIILDTECEVVLSSAWRHHPDGMKEVEKVLATKILDRTHGSWYDKETDHHSTRGEEIQKWLDEHPEVVKYAILDDDSDMLDIQRPNFFKTTFLNGLTPEIAKAVTEHLKD